jgi:predicted DNA binding CopG/RHH family protein
VRIATSVTPATQAAFHVLAMSRGRSDSRLVAELIHAVLKESTRSKSESHGAGHERDPASARITMRLRPADAMAIARRAAARELRPATYLALLVHAHVADAPSIPRAEIRELKRAVASLSAVGRNLNQLILVAHRDRVVDADTRALLKPLALGVEQVRQAVRAHALGNLVSWSIPDA